MTNDKQPAALADHPERQLEMVGRWYMVDKIDAARAARAPADSKGRTQQSTCGDS